MDIKIAVKELPLSAYCKIKSFLQDREGATAIEYAVIAGLISIALLLAAGPIGTRVGELMEAIRTAIGA